MSEVVALTTRGTPDLMLMQIPSREDNGAALGEELQRHPSIPIVFMTAHPMRQPCGRPE